MAKPGDNAAAFAARFGVTVKALRVYEREGLLQPPRSEAGWRAYGDKEAAQLAAVLAMKRLGLPLARVRDLLHGFRGDLGAVLALQEQALEARQTELVTALAIVREARARLARGASLSADDLAQLAKETAMPEMKWTDELEALSKKHYTEDQRRELLRRELTPPEQAAIKAEWDGIFADGQTLLRTDPAAPAAQAWVQRWRAAAEKFTLGRKDLWENAARFNAEAMADPRMKHQMPGTPELWAYAAQAMKLLLAKG
ncbi:MAG: MerR family transcriptional regulator [Alphaproteobacteria bacterium]|nr:MerR family transcriptional regulator [Alphaproteobacteria bacterium]